ncbi:MAG: methyl-accepting chemotaxis protein, partial [Ruminiclostridium sp.]
MKSIKTKIILTFVITASALVLALGLFTTLSSYFGALNQTMESMKSYAKLAAQRISYEVKSYSNIAADLGGNPEFSDHTSDPDTKKALLDSFVNYYGLERGNIIASDGKSIFDGKDYSDRVYFQKAMEGQPYVSDPVVSKIT